MGLAWQSDLTASNLDPLTQEAHKVLIREALRDHGSKPIFSAGTLNYFESNGVYFEYGDGWAYAIMPGETPDPWVYFEYGDGWTYAIMPGETPDPWVYEFKKGIESELK